MVEPERERERGRDNEMRGCDSRQTDSRSAHLTIQGEVSGPPDRQTAAHARTLSAARRTPDVDQ